jgi:hypothetical protein
VLIRACFSGKSIGEIGFVCQAKFNLMMLWGNGKVETEGWAMKGAYAETVNQLLVEDPVFSRDLVRRAENGGDLVRPIP